jgi:bisphosphoglycerate-dependent phosphoglycerate mutase
MDSHPLKYTYIHVHTYINANILTNKRKFPKTESLKDCMSRTIPYYTDVIVPNSIEKGKSVLIASSENAIRGLLMYLCDIPEDKINEVVLTYIHTYTSTPTASIR